MTNSRKYGRTYHYPFSLGTTSDDRINHDYWQDVAAIKTIVHTEKLDGENNCLNRYGVFARSHAAPSVSPWTRFLREKWEVLKGDLDDLEIFGENLYAIHSIQYQQIESHFYVFGIRENERWLSWEETQFYASFFDFPTVPVLKIIEQPFNKKDYEENVLALVQQKSVFGSLDFSTQEPCTMEGIVSRNVEEYLVEDFTKNVFKYVRKGHVKTDEHWTRNWQRAKLMLEIKD